jgi:hypothetical protein
MMNETIGLPVQLGFVVPDLDAAIRHWTEQVGAGPFFVTRSMPIENYQLRGVPSAPTLAAALGYWGTMQIELIETTNDAPSVYSEFAARAGEGLQHVCIRRTTTLDETIAAMMAKGYTVAATGRMTGIGDFAYFESAAGGPMIEVGAVGPEIMEKMQAMLAASQDWDGTDPVRPLPFGG